MDGSVHMTVDLHALQEAPHVGTVVSRLAQLLSLVEERVELARSEGVTHLFEKHADGLTVAHLLEVRLCDADLSSRCRVHQVNGLWLVAVVLEVSHRSPLFEGDVSADSGAAEGSVLVFGTAHLVSAVWLGGAAQVIVGSQLILSCLASNALGSVPHSAKVALRTISKTRLAGCLALAVVLNLAEVVVVHGLCILNCLLDNHSLGVGIFDTLVMDCLGGAIEQPLLPEAKTVSVWVALNHRIRVPVVLALSLLARCEVGVSLFVHLGVSRCLIHRAVLWVKKLLGVDQILRGQTESPFASLGLLGPLVAASVALAKRFAPH